MIKLEKMDLVKFSNVDLIIKRFIETKPKKFVNSSIKEIADMLFISVATITHFVKKAGFANFKDLKKYVIEKIDENTEKGLFDMNDKIENVNLFYVHSLEKTLELLDLAIIHQVTQKIMTSSKVITFGAGSSAWAALEMVNALNIVGINAVNARTLHDISLWIDEDYKKAQMIVIFSKSMNSKENNQIIKLLDKHKIKVCLITANKKIHPSENVDVIYFATLEQEKRIVPLSSKIAEMFILDIISLKLNSLIKKEHGNFYHEFQELWRSKKKNFRKD
ncbi:MurR/RpiR family transcriptional regulator [Mycoplasma iguanae]|uniref:MurR/RpiR family transcriptional regulator n=1 Tax=Mycoplasma iguanae TaxID=292461 RepID=A0ABY5R9A3_9MOLU|nr:MurR/RpiR family transcriptional regulator [Mycoplasma iguanae]UVD81871.1 MurR/RpiR family transcriptional regulator [Mycoplasma iguanae]